jgi:hypothetical protein
MLILLLSIIDVWATGTLPFCRRYEEDGAGFEVG